MKGGQRSHRPSSSADADDWGDGSWVVDCVCGVTFDDGEEMVNCDECGVWVHTRCSRFVKGHTSFACDKCKNGTNNRRQRRHQQQQQQQQQRNEEREETEVAQLLAELPTKTLPLRMESFSISMSAPAPVSATAPTPTATATPTLTPPSFRTIVEVPMEDRVHVQGIPGGEPELFQGFESARVFSRELWKCTGYVPKKLNFQYREFPCWDDKENIHVPSFTPSKVTAAEGLKALEEKPRGFDGRSGDDSEEVAVIWKEKSVPSDQEPRQALSAGMRSDSKGFGSHHKHHHQRQRQQPQQQQQGLKGEKHQRHHHGQHHHRGGQGKRKKEEGADTRDHGGKKKVKSSGDRDKDKEKEEKLRKKGQGQGSGSQGVGGTHTSKGHLRLTQKNPKAMRNLAAQKFLDDDMKARSSGCSKDESHEPACHDPISGKKLEVHNCEIEEAVGKCMSLDNRDIKSEECRQTPTRDTELDGTFKKQEVKKNVEKLKSTLASRTHSTEILNGSFICTMPSELQEKFDKKDCYGTGKMGKLSPSMECRRVQPEENELAGVKIKQEDAKIAVEDFLTHDAGKHNIELGISADLVVNAEHAIESEFASSKSLSANHLQVDAVPSQSVTSSTLNGGAASNSVTSVVKVKCEVKDEPAMPDVSPSLCFNTHITRESLGEGCKRLEKNLDEPIACSQSKQSSISGNYALKQVPQLSGLVARSSRPDDGLQTNKQPLGHKQEDHFQATKDSEDVFSQSGQSKDNVGNIDLKSGMDSAKQILAEPAYYQDDSVSEDKHSKLEQSFQAVSEHARVSPRQSSVLQQESRLQSTRRPRFTLGSSTYSGGAIALSMQAISPRPVAGSSKANSGAVHLHKNAAGGLGRMSNSNSVLRPPISVANSKSSSQAIKSSMNPLSSSSVTKSIHLSKQHLKSGNSTNFKKDDVGNNFGKGSNAGSHGNVSPEPSSFKPVVKENVKCSTYTTVKAASQGKSSTQGGSSKQSLPNSKGHNSFPSSKACAGSNMPLCSSSAEQVPEMQSQHHSSMQTKPVTLAATHKYEKSNLLAPQSVLKANAALPPAHPQVLNSVSATLSDEELALLLHQELNSSPRVPRVSRVRHTGTSPQLASPTPLSGTFVKRPTAFTPQGSSVSEQKDTLVSRRRNKEDNSREGYLTSVQGVDESVKAEGLLSSPDARRLDESSRADDFLYSVRKEVQSKSLDTSHSSKRDASSNNVQNVVEGSSHSIAFDSNDGPLSSVHASPGELSDDAENTITGGCTLTLPGLIDEILSKNQHMSYDELCEAVLPHWQNLRKNNGERYAYSKPGQAVLDCLRNRTAWAHLVDRGPKTGMGRKRRRIDPAVAADSENEEDAEGRHYIHEDEQYTGRLGKLDDVGNDRTDSLASDRQKDIDIATLEDVPKGKRKARRRRPVALKGKKDMDEHKRSRKEAQQSYKIEGLIQVSQRDDCETFSPSSEDAESNYSEDDHVNLTRAVKMRLSSTDASADELELTP